jgi:hypothetical protein
VSRRLLRTATLKRATCKRCIGRRIGRVPRRPLRHPLWPCICPESKLVALSRGHFKNGKLIRRRVGIVLDSIAEENPKESVDFTALQNRLLTNT